MRYAINKDHLDFFYRHHYIEFENLLSPEEIERLKNGISETLASRLSLLPEKLSKQSLKTLYLAGFDIWRNAPDIKKIALRPHFAEIAASLTKKKPLRIGFDQAFCTPPHLTHSNEEMPPLFQKETSLSQTSCLQGIACGLILHLSSPAVPTEPSALSIEEDIQALTPIPRLAGNGIFFSPEMPLSLDYLTQMPDVHQLLIVYAEERSLYRLCEEDPHTHTYKKLGYVFGDRLKNGEHPILYRG